MKSLYLDHAATTPILPVALEAMQAGFAMWANPSSPHKQGRAARAALEQARLRIAGALGWDGTVIFTSGASEALALAITHSALPLAAVSSVEHDAVLRHAEGVERIGVNDQGRVDVDAVGRVGLVAIQQVNSETGVIQPLRRIGIAVHEVGGLLLADCAQSAGKVGLPDADMIVIAAHKFGGPVGVGALLVRDLKMLKPGGGQERGYRGGTESLPGVLGMAAALEAGNAWMENASRLRLLLEQGVTAAGGEVVAGGGERIATIGSYRMPGVSSAVQLIRFDGEGISVSAGSACSSGSLKPSHVLKAMGMDEKAASEVIRVSIGRETTETDVRRFLEVWREIAGSRAAA